MMAEPGFLFQIQHGRITYSFAEGDGVTTRRKVRGLQLDKERMERELE